MELLIVAVLALVAGFLIGAVAGARRALGIVLSARSTRAGVVPAFMPSTMPTRTAADILAGRVRIRLGTSEYTLPVLPRGPARRWLAQLDARFARLSTALDEAANDAPAALRLLTAEADGMYDMLRSYDAEKILPPRDDETMTDAQILHAVLEVWRAVHPLVAAVPSDVGSTTSTSSEPPNTPPTPTDGAPATSPTR